MGTYDFDTHPFLLYFDDERCIFHVLPPNSGSPITERFDYAGQLLAVFLNREYSPFAENADWLDAWDHEKVNRLVRDIYFSGNACIDALPPSQRFRVNTAFHPEEYLCEYIEQPYTDPRIILREMDARGVSFRRERDAVYEKKHGMIDAQGTKYEAACRFASTNNVALPHQVQYRFPTVGDLIFWLLHYVIERNMVIKSCEYCGKYFVPRRNTKKFCSELCATRQRDEDGFCGVPEIRVLYKRIVSNLTEKNKRMAKLRLPYVSGDDKEPVDPRAVLKQFYSENADYLNTLRDAHSAVQKKTPTADEQKHWETTKLEYLLWLHEQYDYATGLKLDKDGIL